ncbi:MFS transporter [Paenibacillus amylolyticus]|uniref:MFS transporter n=1 Tax=Paenibacillus amylolyticus TaxID=1451 RepID=UPI000B8624AD|nr:glycoside-pentoside-hexuronide (GPH):cation symporter [Paenibacillus amylolyticus]
MFAESKTNEEHPVESSSEIPLQLRKGQLVGDSMGVAGGAIISLIFSSFAMYYLTSIAQLDGIMLGTLVLVGSIIGAVSSFVTGIMIDKFNSKYGKVRPWVLVSILPMAGSLLLLFSIPESLAVSTQMVWAGICIILFNIGTSMYSSASGSLIPMATRNQLEVTKMGSSRALGTMGGAMLVSLGYVPLVELVGGDRRAYLIVTAIIIILGSLLIFNQFRTSRENVKTVNRDASGMEKKVPFKDAIVSILKNKYFLAGWLILFTSTTMLAMNNASTVYYARYILGNINMQSLLSLVSIVPSLLVLAALPILVKKMGVRVVILIGTIFAIAGMLIRLLDTSSIPLAFIGFILSGMGALPMSALVTALINSTIDYGEWKSGIRSPGMMMSLVGMAALLASSLSISSIGWILGATHYDGSAAQQSESAIQGILTISIYLPTILASIAFICVLFWRLEKQHPQIVSELRARNGEN